jgi:hypothetical protein
MTVSKSINLNTGVIVKVKAVGWCLSPKGFDGYKQYHEGTSQCDDFVDGMTKSMIFPPEDSTHISLLVLDQCSVVISGSFTSTSFISKPSIFFVKVLVVELARIVWVEVDDIIFNKVN